MGMLEGKVAVITGAGRGIGRGEAILFAREGARVVVNDLGGEWDGSGSDDRPASQVVDEIKAAGGEAVPHFQDVSEPEGRRVAPRGGARHVGPPRRGGQQRRHPPGPDGLQHVDRGVGLGHQGPPPRPLPGHPRGDRALARAVEGRRAGVGPHHQHDVHLGPPGDRRPVELRGGQGRHRRVHPDRVHGGGPDRGDRERHRPRCPDPDDREHVRRPVDPGRRVRRPRPRQRRADGRLPGERRRRRTSPARCSG